ncbi:MAG: flagellar basal-body rod protein FlgF [Proteobacteria bacterium]|nr:flagellar basal-body rod protein FlgF [Pseudomonadota bacterium]
MQQSMYSAMFGAMTQEHRMNIIANNLANVNTTGYKRDRQAFKDVFESYAHDTIREPMMNLRSKSMFPAPDYYAKPRIAVSKIEFTQGSLKQTGGDLDVAISGEGFFKVRTRDGQDYFTRNGAFSSTAEGQLVDGSGNAVLGEGGPIELPPNSRISIDGLGNISADGNVIDTLQFVGMDNLDGLQKFGKNYYEPVAEGSVIERPVVDGSIAQGFLEAPNVEVVTEMVNMIETQRAFEAYQKVISTTGETDLKAISKVGSNQ